jgi:hypothetical protein
VIVPAGSTLQPEEQPSVLRLKIVSAEAEEEPRPRTSAREPRRIARFIMFKYPSLWKMPKIGSGDCVTFNANLFTKLNYAHEEALAGPFRSEVGPKLFL